ncbi:MAG: hypothetical protein J6J53_02800, partial [Muribaculaceae bacterium]|nr:hypothetical protein [Muribaculaceae bacterium]
VLYQLSYFRSGRFGFAIAKLETFRELTKYFCIKILEKFQQSDFQTYKNCGRRRIALPTADFFVADRGQMRTFWPLPET